MEEGEIPLDELENEKDLYLACEMLDSEKINRSQYFTTIQISQPEEKQVGKFQFIIIKTSQKNSLKLVTTTSV